MTEKKRIIRLMITPQTHVRSTQHDKWLFAVTDEYLAENYPPRYLLYKKRLQRYNFYKASLRAEAERVGGFELPDSHFWVKFYLPMPKSWRRKKRAAMAFEPHRSRPDASNLYKAFEDALKVQDMTIWDARFTKYWDPRPVGYIEIELPPTYLLRTEMVGQRQQILQDHFIK